MTASKDIHLVLGSGGARGLTHIGVIRELEAQGYRIRSITGCSIGALIGGLHMAGQLDAYEEWVTQLTQWDVLRFLDISLISRNGMVKGDKIMEKLADWIGDVTLEELPNRFASVAADIKTGKEIWIDSGSLMDAIRASISIPGVFTPLMKNGRVLVDGGILNPLPVPPIVLDDPNITVVAVSLSGRTMTHPYGEEIDLPKRKGAVAKEKYQDVRDNMRERMDGFLDSLQDVFGLEKQDKTPREEEPSFTDVMLGMFNTMQNTIARHQLANNPPDVLIEIPFNICQTHEFFKAKQLIPAGAYWAKKAMDEQFQGAEK